MSSTTVPPPLAGGEAKRNARALVIATGVLVVAALAPVAVGLVGAVVLFEICAVPYRWAARRIPPRLAAGLIAVVVFGFVIGPVVWLGHRLSARLPAVIAGLAGSHAAPANAAASGVIERLQAEVAHAMSAAGEWLPGVLLSLGRGMASSLLNWSIALLGMYYLLTAAPTSWPRFARALPLSSDGAETLRLRLHDITQGVVAGTMLSAAVQGAVIGAGLWLAGIPDALFWGVCAAVATLIPVVGNGLVWIPALLLMIVRQHYDGVIAIGICGGLMPPIIDRVVRASVSRNVGRVHPMITLVGALAGMQVAGIAGIILGPVILAMFFVLVETYREEYVTAAATE